MKRRSSVELYGESCERAELMMIAGEDDRRGTSIDLRVDALVLSCTASALPNGAVLHR